MQAIQETMQAAMQTAMQHALQKAIQTAIKNPTFINMKMVKAQQSRQMLDLIVGFKISPLLWANINRAKGLSAGKYLSSPTKLRSA